MGKVDVYIALGSNLGDRNKNIAKALSILDQHDQIEVACGSDPLETEPLGDPDIPKFLNSVAHLQTSLEPLQLLDVLLQTENSLGRTRDSLSRTIDIDLLLYDCQIIHNSRLTVPHPRMHLRSFVLEPLSKIAPDLKHPALNETVSVLKNRLNCADFELPLTSPQLISIAGNIGVGKTTLTNKLTELLDCPVIHEPYHDNPFLPAVYSGKHELALDSQLFFLTKRARQLSYDIITPGKCFISDYLFHKELIYAELLLDETQFDLYKELFAPITLQICPPTLVIYLNDTPENCLNRIHQRNRPYEQQIDLNFLSALRKDYDQLFKQWRTCPVIHIDMAKFDTEKDIQNLITQIKAYTVI